MECLDFSMKILSARFVTAEFAEPHPASSAMHNPGTVSDCQANFFWKMGIWLRLNKTFSRTSGDRWWFIPCAKIASLKTGHYAVLPRLAPLAKFCRAFGACLRGRAKARRLHGGGAQELPMSQPVRKTRTPPTTT